jgi:DHA1 family tetracycline resistance protein-like MFS transporter
VGGHRIARHRRDASRQSPDGNASNIRYTAAAMRRTSLLVLFLTVFIDLIGFGMVIPFLPFYAREYGASGIAVGAVVGIYSIMQFFFAPIWGRLSDRIGRRPVLLISLTASLSGYALFAFARSFLVLLLSRLVAGIGGANIGTAQAYIADSTTPENRARGMGLIGAAFGMGFILGPPLSAILSTVGQHHGLAGNLLPGLAAAGMSLTALTVAFFVLGESKTTVGQIRSGIPPQFDPKIWRLVGSNPPLALILAALFLTLLAVAGMETSVTLHARDRFNFRQRDLAWFFIFMGLIVATIQGGLIGRLARALGERTLAAIGAGSFTLGLVLLPSIYRVPLLYAAAFFIAVGQGLTYPSLTSLVTRTTDPAQHGSILGIAAGIGSLARFVGPIIAGFLYDLFQARGAFYGGTVFVFLALLAILRLRSMALLPVMSTAQSTAGQSTTV